MTAQPAPMSAAPAPRWGEQTGFFQRHQAAFWLFVVVLVITGLDFLAQQLQMISAEPTAWVTTVILLVPYAVPVIAIIYLLDLYEREPVGRSRRTTKYAMPMPTRPVYRKWLYGPAPMIRIRNIWNTAPSDPVSDAARTK